MALNPDYEPLGFTINSLSSCSPGVLNDTLKTTKAAMATILSTIGKKYEKWRQIMCNDQPFSSWTRILFVDINQIRNGDLLQSTKYSERGIRGKSYFCLMVMFYWISFRPALIWRNQSKCHLTSLPSNLRVSTFFIILYSTGEINLWMLHSSFWMRSTEIYFTKKLLHTLLYNTLALQSKLEFKHISFYTLHATPDQSFLRYLHFG